jgi:hypothetical protein
MLWVSNLAGKHKKMAAMLSLAVVLTAGPVIACPICFSGMVTPIGQKIDAADAVVLATPVTPTGPYKVAEILKGQFSLGAFIVGATQEKRAFTDPGKPFLLSRNKLSQQWTALGTIGEGDANWLRQFAAGGPSPDAAVRPQWPQTVNTTSDLTAAEWADRLVLVTPKIEDAEPLLAEIAYGELARTPYGTLRSLRGSVKAADIAGWLDDPGLAARSPAYTLLFGIVGGPAEAVTVERWIEASRQKHDVKNLPALIAADLEIRGASRLAWVEENYLADRSRGLPEIEAALLALSVQGTVDAKIPRSAIVELYRRFIRERPPMAAFVVQDLSDWQAFEAAEDMEGALRSGAIKDPGSQFTVLTYLKRNPAAIHLVQQGVGTNLAP